MTTAALPGQLVGRRPQISPDRLLAELNPPPHFAQASFETYRPDPDHPSQAAALAQVRAMADVVTRSDARRGRGWFRRRGAGRSGSTSAPGVYLDGGFGVGKTHLLAALAHAVGPDRAAYGTFVEITNLVGALGFAPTVQALAGRRLVCIDEFELDDPGDTVLMARLLRELSDRGVALAATSNTLPGSLGEGRFAAEDFLREIQALADRFEVTRIDGEDYRHRPAAVEALTPTDDGAVQAALVGVPGAVVDDFAAVLAHLAQVHPSRYGALLDGVRAVGWTGVGTVPGQAEALRLVVLVDRLYDRDVPVLLGGAGPQVLFDEAMLRGGYRKKYYRALSRLTALAQAGAEIGPARP